MQDLRETTRRTAAESDTLSEVADADKKKKSLDEMIEEFNRDNPSKSLKKMQRGLL